VEEEMWEQHEIHMNEIQQQRSLLVIVMTEAEEAHIHAEKELEEERKQFGEEKAKSKFMVRK
jgi:hypothetical protein